MGRFGCRDYRIPGQILKTALSETINRVEGVIDPPIYRPFS